MVNLSSMHQYFKRQEKKYRKNFLPGLPIIVRLDGKDITKNREEYPLLKEDGFTKKIFDKACSLYKDPSVIIYAFLDEVNFIFTKPDVFLSEFDDGDQMYATSILLQRFTKGFDELFGCTSFQTENWKVYLAYRKELAFQNYLVYYMKNLGLEHYKYTDSEKLQYVKDHDLKILPVFDGLLSIHREVQD